MQQNYLRLKLILLAQIIFIKLGGQVNRDERMNTITWGVQRSKVKVWERKDL